MYVSLVKSYPWNNRMERHPDFGAERCSGSFQRSCRLPIGVKADKINASFEIGAPPQVHARSIARTVIKGMYLIDYRPSSSFIRITLTLPFG